MPKPDALTPNYPNPKEKPLTQRNILLILGMHRSGTSFLTHCTEAMGFTLPDDRSDPAVDNPNGHFEPRAIVALNDAIMVEKGAHWARIAGFEAAPDPKEMAAAFTTSFGQHELIVLKDPRMTLLMSMWRPFLDAQGTTSGLISFRHPTDVAASLSKRDGILPEHSYLSWILHNIAALEATEGMNRALLLFPDWTNDVEKALSRISDVTRRSFPVDALRQIKARFKGAEVTIARTYPDCDSAIACLAHDLFGLLARHAREGSIPAPAAVSAFRARFDELSRSARAVEAYRDSLDVKRQEIIRQQHKDNLSLQKQVEEVVDERHQVVRELQAQRDDVSEKLGGQLNDAQSQIKIAEEQLLHLTELLKIERQTILKPIYRRVHRAGGHILRGFLSERAFNWLKRSLPYPGRIPGYLAYAPDAPRPDATHRFRDIPPGEPGKPDIFIMSIIDWDFRIQRPQHLATELGRAGHRVFYIEMQADPADGHARQVAPNVHVLRLPGRGLRGAKPYCGSIPGTTARAWVNHFYALADAVNASSCAHIIVEHPYWWNFVRHLSSQFQITFDCMDEISGFSNTDQALLDLESDMIARADKMVVSSQYLFDKHSVTRPVALIRNGADLDHFLDAQGDSNPPSFLDGKLAKGSIRIGYVGAIADWFDTDLVEAVASSNPDFDIHLCGSVTAEAPARLLDLKNVTLHGEIPYADVPGFMLAMDVLIIPFQLLPIINACDPVKFYEYAAVQKPVVSTPLPELARAGDLVITASDAGEFAAGIREASKRASDPTFTLALRDYAVANAWHFRANDLMATIDAAPKVSVVILSFGPAELTLNCLRSLTGKGPVYPDCEILIVDNGSDPDDLQKLREAAGADDRVRLIENGANLGFARGNNIGIEAAQGEFILLLNNDTYVPPGAIAAMVRHLQHDPEIGVIGPMTNNIGNEARIEVEYTDMAGMAAAARQLTTGYRGDWTELQVAAYFCVMFRKADLDRIGGLPTAYGRGMFEDDDHCATFRAAGLVVALAEDAFVHHQLSATFDRLPTEERQELFNRNRRIFEERWGKWTPHRYRHSRPRPSLPTQ